MFDQVEIKTYEASAYTEFARSLLNRAPAELEDFMTKLFSASILNGVDSAIFSGDGNGKPKGILASGNCNRVPRATAGTVTYDDVINCKYGVPPQLRRNGVWFVADDSLRALEELTDIQGRPLFLRSLSEAAPDTLDGRPLYVTTRLSGTTLGSLIYGAPGYYMMGVEQDVVIAKSEHFKFSSGVVAFRAFTLIGGNVYEPKAFAALDIPA